MKGVFVSFWEKAATTAIPTVEVEKNMTESGTKEWRAFISALQAEAKRVREERCK
ncbi:hypothetical protein [Shouchella lonarensis]|uniref:Uncharacterized protein n=1 Tax=Shouchella lonarensis TaxID=1464122 RepID=A0A1G6GKE7_9BACI|nr:hypothetical protein [Shouchella lonarensis]SDB82502.1 hypothetical protein SAMN05421737_101190 [Shouchella lonarensis]